jgi:hypothetical protein
VIWPYHAAAVDLTESVRRDAMLCVFLMQKLMDPDPVPVEEEAGR